MADFKEFKVKLVVDTSDGTKNVETTINSLEDYQKILDDLNKKKTKPGITAKELEDIDKQIKQLNKDFTDNGNELNKQNTKLEATQANYKKLVKERKNYTAGSEEFKKLTQEIDDMKDSLDAAGRTSKSFSEQLEAAPGPVGMIARGFETLKGNVMTFGGALKASGIGLILSIVGGITAAFAGNEKATKKLQPLLIGMEKIFNGLYNVFEPLLNAFMDMANVALPYIMDGIGGFYSGLVALFTLLKEAGTGVGKILKGIFTLDYDAITNGYEQLTGSWNKAVTQFKTSFKAYEKGTQEVTKTEKKNAEDRKTILEKELDDKKEAIDKTIQLEVNKQNTSAAILEEELKKKDDIENKKWELEHKGVKVSQETLDLQAQVRKKFIEDALKEDDDYFKEQQDKRTEVYKKLLDDLQKYLDEEKNKIEKSREQNNKKDIESLKQKLIDGLLTQEQYDRLLLDKNVEFAQKKQKDDENAAYNRQAMLLLNYEAGLINLGEYYAAATQAEIDYQVVKTDNEIAVTDAKQERDLTNKEKEKEQQTTFTEQLKELDQSYTDATIRNKMAVADAVGTLGGLIGQFAGDSKELAIAGLLIEKAAALSSIIINSMAQASQIRRSYNTQPFFFPGTFFPNPLWGVEKGIMAKELATNKIQTGIGIGVLAASTIQGIAGINSAFKAKSEKKQFGGILDGPLHANGGITTPYGELEGGEYVVNRASTMMFRPALDRINSLGGGLGELTNSGNNPTFDDRTAIIKTYVVASEMSSQQEIDRIIKQRSKL